MLALQSATGHNTATYDARINGLILRARAFLESINLIELDNITADIIHKTDIIQGNDKAENAGNLSSLYTCLTEIKDAIEFYAE